MPDLNVISDFLAQPRIAFAGASRDPKQFANAVYRGMRTPGRTLVPVHPQADRIEGDATIPSIAALPQPVDGVLVMLPPEAALGLVREAVDAGVPRVWLHKGVGVSAVSAEAVQYCRDRGVAVVDGACPLMFVEPVGGLHRVHRFFVKRRFSAAA